MTADLPAPLPDFTPAKEQRPDLLAHLDTLERAVVFAHTAIGGNRKRIAAKSVFEDMENRDAVECYEKILYSPRVQEVLKKVKKEDLPLLPYNAEITAQINQIAQTSKRDDTRLKALDMLARMKGILADKNSPNQTNVQNNIQLTLEEFKKKEKKDC